MNDETRRYLDAHTDPAEIKALWSWVEGGPFPCPICGEPGGFHSSEPVMRARREGESPLLRDMLAFPGHRQAREDIPPKLTKRKATD